MQIRLMRMEMELMELDRPMSPFSCAVKAGAALADGTEAENQEGLTVFQA